MIDVNPLDHLKKRKLDWKPVHFKKTKLHQYVNVEKVNEWITYRLKGRYCIVSEPCIDKDDKVRNSTFVAFEDEKEITYFILACPYLRSI
jgi:hypothetical protein